MKIATGFMGSMEIAAPVFGTAPMRPVELRTVSTQNAEPGSGDRVVCMCNSPIRVRRSQVPDSTMLVTPGSRGTGCCEGDSS